MAVTMSPELLDQRLAEARQTYKLNVGWVDLLTGWPLMGPCASCIVLTVDLVRDTTPPSTCSSGGGRGRGAKGALCACCCCPIPFSAFNAVAPAPAPLPAAMLAWHSCLTGLWTQSSGTTRTSWSWSCPGACRSSANGGQRSCGRRAAAAALAYSPGPGQATAQGAAPSIPHPPASPRCPPPCSNNLAGLPDELSQLQRLRVLRLKYNQLRRLPSVAAALPELTVLELAGNQISKLDPAVVGALVSVRELDLSGNALTELPSAIARLPKLEALHLENNRRARMHMHARARIHAHTCSRNSEGAAGQRRAYACVQLSRRSTSIRMHRCPPASAPQAGGSA